MKHALAGAEELDPLIRSKARTKSRILRSRSPELQYVADIGKAAVAGFTTLRNERGEIPPNLPSPKSACLTALFPAVLCFTVAALGVSIARREKSRMPTGIYGLAAGGIGFLAALACSSAPAVKVISKNTVRRINSVRDEHWLKNNPITYG